MDFEPAFGGDPVYRVCCTRQSAVFIATLAFVAEDRFPALQSARTEFLHPDEVQAFGQLKFERRQRSYLLGRYAAKQALQRLLPQFAPTAVLVGAGVFGQPVVWSPGPPPVGVSIAHCAGAAAAVAFPLEQPLGIDLEPINADRLKAMLTQVQPSERQLDDRLKGDHPDPAWVTSIWTAKEALSKILKCGMTTPFALLELARLAREGNMFSGEFKNFGQYKVMAWQLPAHVFALVAPRRSEIQIEPAPPFRPV
jgi:4'-phosphopantetheinyl transferase